jgi:enoyl-CoA hydratase
MSYVLSEVRDGVAVITLNDPSRRNVLSGALCAELSGAVEQASGASDVHAIVITGMAPAFCAGADLNDLKLGAEGQMRPLEAVYKSFMDVAMSPLPTLAAVNGPAVGAGFNLALACDMRVAAGEAVFDTRFLKLGLHPGGGHTWMLLRAVGWAHASRMLLAGQSVDADEALRIGLVEAVVPGGELLDKAMLLLRATAAAPRELVVRTKATLRLAARSAHEAAFAHETAEQQWSLGQPGFAAAIARMQKR